MILDHGIAEDHVKPELEQASEKIRLVMGPECEVVFEFVDIIPLTKSGKHIYMVRNIPDQAGLPHGALEIASERSLA